MSQEAKLDAEDLLRRLGMAIKRINELESQVEQLRAALERASLLMTTTWSHLELGGCRDTETHYDDAECDGYCLQDDLQIAINDAADALEATK